MQITLNEIPLRETLHFLGWRGTLLDHVLMEQIQEISKQALACLQPRVIIRRFLLEDENRLKGTTLSLHGADVAEMLRPCHEAAVLAATLGAQSERMLLKAQAKDSAQALVLDAVLSAAIEAVCDEAENRFRHELGGEGMYLTDRFSPGYGDMPLEQTRMICEVLNTDRSIGLTVSASGIMIPRKSVTAVMGISRTPVFRRPHGCLGCAMKVTCPMRRNEEA